MDNKMKNMKCLILCVLAIVFMVLSGCVDNNDNCGFKTIIDSNHTFDMYDLTQKKIKPQVISMNNSEAGFTHPSKTFTYTYPNQSDIIAVSQLPIILESHSTYNISEKDSAFRKITFYNPFAQNKELISFNCVSIGVEGGFYIGFYDISTKKKFYFINVPYKYSKISVNTNNFNSNIIEKSLADSEKLEDGTSEVKSNNITPPVSTPITPSIINNISIQNSNQKE